MEEMDADRNNLEVPVAEVISCTITGPVTAGNTRYPDTCVVEVDPGRWPDWLKPHVGWLRRIQTRNDPDYGFITESYNTFSDIAYVCKEPGYRHTLYNYLMAEAKKAGWIVIEWTPNKRFDTQAP